MKLIVIIILIAVIFTILLFKIALKINLVFNSDKSDLNLKLFWLDPFIKASVTIKNTKPVLTLYLFNRIILDRELNRGKSKHTGMELVQCTDAKDIHVNVKYGFGDPFTTGIACGAINVASQFANIDSINQTPDFMTTSDYIYLNATAKVKIGSTLIKLYRS